MSALVGLALLGIAAAMLVGGAELFVEHAAAAASRLGTSVLAAGLILAGAEPEELLTAVIAAGKGRPDLAAGDAIGANLTMFTLALGLAALARPLPFRGRVRRYALLAATSGGLAWLALADGRVGRVEGAGLLGAYAAFVALIWVREKAPPAIGELAELAEKDEKDEKDEKEERRSQTAELLLALLGVAVMLAGGVLAVEGAVRVTAALGQTDTAIGLTLLALATTAELFALVFAAARRGASEIAVAGVVGSAVYNATATLGAAALTRPLVTTGIATPAAAAALLPLAVVALARKGHLGRAGGAVLCAGYAAYLLLVFAR